MSQKYVGIDWADAKHDTCLATSSSSEQEFGVFNHDAQSIDQWAIGLRARFKGGLIAVCLEQTKGPFIYALLKYDFLILYPVNPQSLAHSKPLCYFWSKR